MVGKTSLLTRYIYDEFYDLPTNRTIEAYFSEKIIKINENTFTLNIWDTAGEEKYHALAPIYYRDCDGAILVFDMTKPESFEKVEHWFDELNKTTCNVNKILVGNKCDLQDLKVKSEQARELAIKYGAKFMNASALSNKNVNEIFSTLAIEIFHSHLKKENFSKLNNKRKSIKIMENFDKAKTSGPNIGDITKQYQKIVKPFVERPFIPTEVDKLQEMQTKTYSDIQMTNAILVGPKQKSSEPEKPSMYSTVVSRHPTVIRHQTPQPTNIGVSYPSARSFAADPSQTLNDIKTAMAEGVYSIPVQISNGAIKDPTLSGYETPNFIAKKEKTITSSTEELSGIDPAQYLKLSMEKDIGTFIAQFDNAQDKKARVEALNKGKNGLHNEMEEIANKLSKEINELLYAKEVALKLSHLNNYYMTKIRKDKLSTMKLSDVITLKNILRNKIIQEIKGFRTAPSQYSELENVNPSDIAIIMKNIKLGLGQ